MNKERWAKAAMAVFLAICLLPSLGMLAVPPGRTAANQRLHAAPRLWNRDGRWNWNVLTDTADYLSDHLAFRQELITANAALNAALFHVSTEEQVALGEGDWLFYRHTLADYLHTERLSERQVWCAAHTLALVKAYAAERSASFQVTVAPNKASLYPEHLPNLGMPLEGPDDVERFADALKEAGVDYIDLFAPFREQSETLYFHTDSHWTTRGAALAHDVLCAELKGPEAEKDWAPFFPGGTHTGEPHTGDLYEMLYPAGRRTEPDAAFDRPFAFTYESAFRSPEDHLIETVCPGRTGSLLMFRDSFGNSLHPFLADSFGTARFSRAMPVDFTLLDGEDTILLEIVERNLDYLAAKAPVFPAPEWRGEDLTGEGDKPSANSLSMDGTPMDGSFADNTPGVELNAQDGGTLAGFIRLDGFLYRETDTDSPICVRIGSILYEASPVGAWQEGGTPFTLYVDAAQYTVAEDVSVWYLYEDAWRQTIPAGRDIVGEIEED